MNNNFCYDRFYSGGKIKDRRMLIIYMYISVQINIVKSLHI